MTGYEAIQHATDADGLALITLDRPERLNAFTNRMPDSPWWEPDEWRT